MKRTLLKKLFIFVIAISCFILFSLCVYAAAPVVTFPQEPSAGPVTVVISAPEGYTLAEGDSFSYSIDGGKWITYTEPFEVNKNCSIIAMINHADGTKSEPATVAVSCIDASIPTMPVISADTGVWSATTVTVTITPGTDEGTGVARTEYRIGKSETWIEYKSPIALSSSDAVYARTIDKAGNISPEAVLEISNFDTVGPDISSLAISFVCEKNAVSVDSGTFGSYYGAPVTARIEGASDSQSGLGGYEYQIVGKDSLPVPDKWVQYSPDTQPRVTNDFVGFVYVRAYDKVGNRSIECCSAGLVVDVTAPVISDIVPSTTALTDQRVDITFTAIDAIALDSVTVNDAYVGIYNQKFTAFKNGDYVIVATDKVGNTTTQTFTISNIDADTYSLIRMCESLASVDYTPSTWSVMQASLAELKAQMALTSEPAVIDPLCDKLITSLQGLVYRGDGTETRQILAKIAQLDQTLYTDSTWNALNECITTTTIILENPESTQEDVDNTRRTLETAVGELKLRADFTNLDRIISQSDALDASRYDPKKLEALRAKVDEARALSRTDTTQDTVDLLYYEIVGLISNLPDPKPVEKEPNHLLYFVLIIVLILAVGSGLFLLISEIRRKRREKLEAENDYEYAEPDYDNESAYSSGDIYFSDSDDNEYDDYANVYDGDYEDNGENGDFYYEED